MKAVNSSDAPELIIRTVGNVGHLVLNRPKSLNAISSPMYKELSRQFLAWREDENISAVIIEGAGDRAFCAGGDVKVYLDVQNDEAALKELTVNVFQTEYAMDAMLQEYPKPYIALMDGVTMGGGCGVSVFARHRVVTERTLMAMPETAIGFIPDVGASYFLSRASGFTGLYLGLSGARMSPADALYAGLADIFVESGRMDALKMDLLSGQEPADVLNRYAVSAGSSELQRLQPVIDRCFSADHLEEALSRLETETGGDEGEWAEKTLSVLKSRPPFSLAVAWRSITSGAEMDLKDCLSMEYRVCHRMLKRGDFFEGVRTTLVDKDDTPTWSPSSLENIDEEEVSGCFQPLPRELFFHPS